MSHRNTRCPAAVDTPQKTRVDGKASAAMARQAEVILGPRIHDGVVTTKYGHGMSLEHCRFRIKEDTAAGRLGKLVQAG